MDKRINWDELFMLQVRAYAMRSACLKYQVGTVFIKDKVVVSGGYNGPPRSEPNCIDVGCAKEDEYGRKLPAGSGLCRGAHAEMNSIVNAGAGNGGLKNSTVYCTYSPCLDCAKHLINIPIIEFVYEKEYKESEGHRAIKTLMRRGVKMRKFKMNENVFRKFLEEVKV